MPATTFTSSVMNRTPKDYHVGVNFVKGKFVFPVAGSLSDIINICKVPHGAVIADFYEYHSSGQTAAVIASCVVSGGAIATMNRMSLAASPTGANVQISLSDSDPVRYAVLQGKAVSGTFTTTVSMGWGLFYVMDER
jgi:hypothetical protein